MDLRLKYGTKLSVLIVDDEPEIRETLKVFLESLELFTQIVEAENGSEAFVKCSNQEFDLITTDINMPNKDGIELIRNIKSAEAGKIKTPIILISANINSDNVLKARDLGVKYALKKPCSVEKFLGKVTEVLAREKKNKFEPI